MGGFGQAKQGQRKHRGHTSQCIPMKLCPVEYHHLGALLCVTHYTFALFLLKDSPICDTGIFIFHDFIAECTVVGNKASCCRPFQYNPRRGHFSLTHTQYRPLQ